MLVGRHGGCQGAVALGDVPLALGAAGLHVAPHSQPRGREQQGQQQLQALLPGHVQRRILEPAAHMYYIASKPGERLLPMLPYGTLSADYMQSETAQGLASLPT